MEESDSLSGTPYMEVEPPASRTFARGYSSWSQTTGILGGLPLNGLGTTSSPSSLGMLVTPLPPTLTTPLPPSTITAWAPPRPWSYLPLSTSHTWEGDINTTLGIMGGWVP